MGDSVTHLLTHIEHHVNAVNNHMNDVYKSTTCLVVLCKEAALGGPANNMFLVMLTAKRSLALAIGPSMG